MNTYSHHFKNASYHIVAYDNTHVPLLDEQTTFSMMEIDATLVSAEPKSQMVHMQEQALFLHATIDHTTAAISTAVNTDIHQLPSLHILTYTLIESHTNSNYRSQIAELARMLPLIYLTTMPAKQKSI